MTARPNASLPMYDLPAIRWATDALWRALSARLREAGIAAPQTLDRKVAYAEPWSSPDLLLSQTCGYPYAKRLRGAVRLIATPCYEAPGCEGALYSSALIVRRDDPVEDLASVRDARIAVNATDSQSGHNALRAALAGLDEPDAAPDAFVVTGGHAASVDAVAAGRADLAAIDCVTLALLGDAEPARIAPVRVLAWSPPAPGLPLVTAASRSDAEVERMREALAATLADPSLVAALSALRLRRIEVLDDASYDAVLAMEAMADAAGVPTLA